MKVSQFLPLCFNRRASSLRSALMLLALAMSAVSAFGQTLTTLYSFGAVPGDGVAPGSGVVADKNGNLFGTTAVGGVQGSDGIVFELSPPQTVGGAWVETILHRFRGTPDGKISESRLLMTSKGALIGTTLKGGANDLGTVYQLTPPTGQAAWPEKILYNFGSFAGDVVTPTLGLLSSTEGLYGADQGGANNTGAVYLLTRAAGSTTFTQTILYSFKPTGQGDAAFPSGELVRDSAGNLYGVTTLGGANNLGAIYEVSPPAVPGNPWTETVLYSFNGTDGTLPGGRLLIGSSGQLFGTTAGGGTSSSGTVFQLTPPSTPGSSWTLTTLYNFSGGIDGGFAGSGVIADKKGRLLGAASNAIFMLTPPTTSGGPWTETVLHDFTGPDGFIATTPLTLFNGALYGTTQQGGAFGTGTVFQLTLQ